MNYLLYKHDKDSSALSIKHKNTNNNTLVLILRVNGGLLLTGVKDRILMSETRFLCVTTLVPPQLLLSAFMKRSN